MECFGMKLFADISVGCQFSSIIVGDLLVFTAVFLVMIRCRNASIIRIKTFEIFHVSFIYDLSWIITIILALWFYSQQLMMIWSYWYAAVSLFSLLYWNMFWTQRHRYFPLDMYLKTYTWKSMFAVDQCTKCELPVIYSFQRGDHANSRENERCVKVVCNYPKLIGRMMLMTFIWLVNAPN